MNIKTYTNQMEHERGKRLQCQRVEVSEWLGMPVCILTMVRPAFICLWLAQIVLSDCMRSY